MKKINNPLVKKITYKPMFVVVVKHQNRKHVAGLREINLSQSFSIKRHKTKEK